MKSASIQISSKDSNDDIEMTMFGNAWEENSVRFIEYEEVNQTNFAKFKTVMLLGEDFFKIRRVGEVQSEMTFDLNALSHVVIQTPYGDFDGIIQTKTLKINKTSDFANVEISYDFELGGEIETHHIKVVIKTNEGEKGFE